MLMPTYTGQLSIRLLLWTWIAASSSSKILARANAGLAMRRLSWSSSFERTSFTSTRFHRFSMVFPSCSSTCISPSQSRWRPSSEALYSSGCMAPSKGFGQTGGRDGLWSDACPETCIAADSDSKAHSGPCYGGLGPASQLLSEPPQHPNGGCADTLTSIFF